MTFQGKETRATVSRLCRCPGAVQHALGVGQSIDVTDEIMGLRKWAREWPTVVVDLGVSSAAFARVAASNHYCLIPGDHTRERRGYACTQAGLPSFELIPSKVTIRRFRHDRGRQCPRRPGAASNMKLAIALTPSRTVFAPLLYAGNLPNGMRRARRIGLRRRSS